MKTITHKDPANIFVFDIDGTLMEPGGNKADDESLSALKQISHFGKIVLASARPVQGIINLNIGNEVKVDYLIALNGALIQCATEVIKSFPVTGMVVDFFLDNRRKFNNLWFYTKEDWFSNNLYSPEVTNERIAVSIQPFLLDEYKRDHYVLKITVVHPEDIKDLIGADIADEVEISTSNLSYSEIHSRDTNKYLAVKSLFPEDNFRIFSFGDSDNDWDLLRGSFFSCTVSNASNKAKEASGYIAKSPYGEGISQCVSYVINSFLSE